MDPKAAMGARSRARAKSVRLTATIFVLMSAMPATLLLSAEPAAAASAEVSRRVSYDDLNLGRAAGRWALRQRIVEAARELCGAQEVVLDFKGMRLTERCIAEAIASASPEVELAIAAARFPTVSGDAAAGGR